MSSNVGKSTKKPGTVSKGSVGVLMLDHEQIYIDQDLSRAMPLKPMLVDALVASIKHQGFQNEFPLIAWKREDQYVLIDGRNRYTAAKKAGLKVLPTIIKSFSSDDEARAYIMACQANRRGTDDAVILYYLLHVQLFGRGGDRKSGKIKGTSAPLISDPDPMTLQAIADELATSIRKIKRVKKIHDRLSLDVRELIRSEKLSVYDVLDANERRSTPKIEAKVASNRQKAVETFIRKLHLPKEAIGRLKQRLLSQGKSLEQYLLDLLSTDLQLSSIEPALLSEVDSKTETLKRNSRPDRYQKWDDRALVALGCHEKLREQNSLTQSAMIQEYIDWWSKLTGHHLSRRSVIHQIPRALVRLLQLRVTNPAERLRDIDQEIRRKAL